MASKTLKEEVYSKILFLSKKGEEKFEEESFEEAINYYQQALELLPSPNSQWDAATWLYSAIGDCHYFSQNFKDSLYCFHDAYNAPGGIENPFVNLRLGQCYYELKEKEKAEDYLLRAYMLEGKSIFSSEKAKYFNYLNKKFNL